MNIDLDVVTFTYPSGVVALRGVSLHLASGQAVAIVGENGAGKTTLAKHLNGLLKPSAGIVHVGDWDTSQHSAAQLAARIAYAFQNPDDQLFERTVRAEVAFGPRNLGQPEAKVEARVRSALDQVGLAAEAERHPYDLHAGQRKLLALAAILAMETPVVMLDEPTTGQDARGIELIGQIVEDLKAGGRTVITITHDMDFCAEHFERVVVMSQGRILADGPAEVVLSQHDLLAQAYVEAPELVRLGAALQLTQVSLTVDDFIAALATHQAQQGRKTSP